MKMKNPFKKSNIMDTVVNVGIGGAANAAADFALEQLDLSAIKGYENYIKVGVGVLGGTMVSNKYLRAAVDGIATVGVSNIVNGLISGSTTSTETASGLKPGTIGRVRPGNRYFARSRKVAGVGNSNFMGC